MKHRYMRMLLTGVMICTILAVCSPVGIAAKKPEPTKKTESTEPQKSTGQTEAEEPSGTVPETEPTAVPVTIEEQVLIAEAGIRITAKSYVTEGIWGDGVELLLENATDSEAVVACKALIVNNCMIDNMLMKKVAAGEAVTETLWLADRFLDAAGIQTVGLIEADLFIYDAETRKPMVNNDYVTIKTSAFDTMEAPQALDGTVIYEEKGVRILGRYTESDPLYGTAVEMYAENHSGKNLNVLFLGVKVNGTEIPSMCSGPLYDEKVSYYHLFLNPEELEKKKIEKPEEIEVKLSFMDEDSGLMIGGSVAAKFTVEEAS